MHVARHIVVNATALDRSGALSILRQFIENIPNDSYDWLIFISDKIDLRTDKQNVELKPIRGVKPMHRRLWWDAFGLKKWLKRNDIFPIACISLQNTGFRAGNKQTPRFIYYHQSIPFYPYKWNPMKRQQRSLWFYKNIYPFFVNLFLTQDTVVFVQLEFIKKGFIKKFRHNPDKVKVFSPSVSEPREQHIDLPETRLNLFYPATSFFYKNHDVIINAVAYSQKPITLYLTTDGEDANDKTKHLGMISYDQVCAMYCSCDALVFPSYIETFGLPLIEAAKTGMPIIAADLPYAREVLDGYEGVRFLKHDDPETWRKEIEGLGKGKRYEPLHIEDRPSWKELFNTIKNHI